MKKNLTAGFATLMLLTACKKEGKITETNVSDSLQTGDSLTMQAKNDPNAFSVEPIAQQADVGKTIFTMAGKTIISFDTQGNTGTIKINGEEIPLNELTFSENNYDISGENIKITAYDGHFQEMTSDCNYGDFTNITITYNNHKVVLPNVKVQDCPSY